MMAALPFRSVVALAALGDMLATRVVLVLSTRTRRRAMPNDARHHRGDIAADALAHLDAAGGHAHAAVGVDVNQGVALIEVALGERDAEAPGISAQPFLTAKLSRLNDATRCRIRSTPNSPAVNAPLQAV